MNQDLENKIIDLITERVVQVCPVSSCDKKAYEAEVKSKRYLFCCEKGFLQSLEDYRLSLK